MSLISVSRFAVQVGSDIYSSVLQYAHGHNYSEATNTSCVRTHTEKRLTLATIRQIEA